VHAEVDSLFRLHADYYLQRFTAPRLVFEPGQFIMVKPAGSLDPFLPRAYSILRVRRPGRQAVRLSGSTWLTALSVSKGSPRAGNGKSVVEILYKVIGKGTTALSQLKRGDRVDFLGPLGNGYRVHPHIKTVLLVAGGIGVPPVVALAEHLKGSGSEKHSRRSSVIRPQSSALSPRRLVAFIGGKTRHDVLCVSDLRKARATVHVATEDGSLGHRGLVTDLLESFLRSSDNGEGSSVFACGPHPMLHAVARIAERFGIPCQVSLEAEMGCGFGACMGCVIATKQSPDSRQPSAEERIADSGQPTAYKLCCKDGPVFDAQEIAW
jgi:dihydroorotate dehydrogenase electron transfer subunit